MNVVGFISASFFQKVEAVKPLSSYVDRNFYFRGNLTGKFSGPKGKETINEFVLKITNASVSYEDTIGLNSAMKHLYGKGFQCPYPLLSRSGKETEVLNENQLLKGEFSNRESRGEENKFCARVLFFIPGEMMDKIDQVYVTPRFMYEFGKYIGSIDAALQVMA